MFDDVYVNVDYICICELIVNLEVLVGCLLFKFEKFENILGM